MTARLDPPPLTSPDPKQEALYAKRDEILYRLTQLEAQVEGVRRELQECLNELFSPPT